MFESIAPGGKEERAEAMKIVELSGTGADDRLSLVYTA